jgi:hypothetical protein
MNIFSSALIWMSEILSYVIEITEIFLVNLLGSNSETHSSAPTTEQPEESFEII